MQTKPRLDRPLSAWEKAALAASSTAVVVLCFALPLFSLAALLLVLGIELAAFFVSARIFLARKVAPILAQHTSLLSILAPRFRHRRIVADYRLCLQPADAPDLFSIVRVIAERLQVAPPHEICVEMSGNARIVLEGYRTGAGKTVLCVGYDLLAGMSEAQVEAVLAHEMGHARFVQRGLKRLLAVAVQKTGALASSFSIRVQENRRVKKSCDLEETFRDWADGLTKAAAVRLARYSRQDEFEADRIAAELFGSETTASALRRAERLGIVSARLPWIDRVVQLHIGSFSEWLSAEMNPSIDDSEEQTASVRDPYSTHPLLEDRIAALPDDNRKPAEAAPGLCLLVEPDGIAEKLIEEVQRISAHQELEETKELARASRKQFGPTNIGVAAAAVPLLIAMGVLLGAGCVLDGSYRTGAEVAAVLVGTGLAARKWGRYRDRTPIPVPDFQTFSATRVGRTVGEDSEKAKELEAQLNDSIASQKGNRRRAAFLITEAYGALGRCDYLRADAAARLAVKIRGGCYEAEIALMATSAGLSQKELAYVSIQRVRSRAGFGTFSALWSAGWALSLMGEWAAAEACIWRALQLQPKHATLWMLLAIQQKMRGKTQSAIRSGERATSLSPGDPEIEKLHMKALLDGRRIVEAEKKATYIEAFATSDPYAAMLMVSLHLLLRQNERALEFANTLRKASGDPAWLINLGQAFEESTAGTEARTFFYDACAHGHCPEALFGLARLAISSGEVENAQCLLLAALNIEAPVCAGANSLQLFHPIISQLTRLQKRSRNCLAWTAVFPQHATPRALSGHVVLVFADSRANAEIYLGEVLQAMTPSSRTTPTIDLDWCQAPQNQQPQGFAWEGVQAVL